MSETRTARYIPYHQISFTEGNNNGSVGWGRSQDAGRHGAIRGPVMSLDVQHFGLSLQGATVEPKLGPLLHAENRMVRSSDNGIVSSSRKRA
jgi:hypothetical protein